MWDGLVDTSFLKRAFHSLCLFSGDRSHRLVAGGTWRGTLTCSLHPISNVGEESLCCVLWFHLPVTVLEKVQLLNQILRKFINAELMVLSTIWWSGLRFQLWLLWLTILSLEASQYSFELMNEIRENILFAKTQTIQIDPLMSVFRDCDEMSTLVYFPIRKNK